MGQNGHLSLEWVPLKMISNLLVVFHLQLDVLNSLVMAGAMLCDVDFNILADIPSGPFDLETSSEPSSNSTSSSVQRRYDGHNKGSVSGRSSPVSGGSDRLKCCEKHCPSKVAFSKFEFAVVPFLCSVGMDDVSRFRHLMAFQKSLELEILPMQPEHFQFHPDNLPCPFGIVVHWPCQSQPECISRCFLDYWVLL